MLLSSFILLRAILRLLTETTTPFPSLVFVMILVVTSLAPMILMIPMAFMQLPPLPVVIIMRVVPVGSFIRRTVPPPCHPAIMPQVRSPISIHPGIARTRHLPTSLDSQRRRRPPHINTDLRWGRSYQYSREQ